MNTVRSVRIFILICLVATLVAAASPVQAAQTLVRLTIDNRTTKTIFFSLSGPSRYFLSVKAGEGEVFTVTRGEYNYSYTACGVFAEDTLDLTSAKLLIMPVCGGSAKKAAETGRAVDLSVNAKVVKVTLTNDASTNLLAIFTGTATYVFSFKEGEEKTYTIGKGDYDITYYACGDVGTRSYYFAKGSKLTFECP